MCSIDGCTSKGTIQIKYRDIEYKICKECAKGLTTLVFYMLNDELPNTHLEAGVNLLHKLK